MAHNLLPAGSVERGARRQLARKPAWWRPRRRLARWRSAGILLTYRCNASCADCYENSSPRRRRLLPPEDLRRYLRDLRQLGFSGRSLHFGGGEPFFHDQHLITCLEVAREEGMLPLGKLETNAFWCKSDDLVRERLGRIQRLGLVCLSISCDVFHQEFVPLERVRRALRIGREVLGERAVRVSSPEFLDAPVDVTTMSEEKKLEAFREVASRDGWRMVGRAAQVLSPLVERWPAERFAGDDCAKRILGKGTIHVDPYGNVFPSTCAGIVLGNAREHSLCEIQRTFALAQHPVVKTLVEHGPLALHDEARGRAAPPAAAGFASKCHLCYAARRQLWERELHRDEIGPGEIYAG